MSLPTWFTRLDESLTFGIERRRRERILRAWRILTLKAEQLRSAA